MDSQRGFPIEETSLQSSHKSKVDSSMLTDVKCMDGGMLENAWLPAVGAWV